MEPASHHMGNVLLDPMGFLLVSHQSSLDPLQIPAKLLRRMLLSSIWQSHQRGHFGLHEAAQRLSQLPFLADNGWAADNIIHVLQNRVVLAVQNTMQLLDFLHEKLHLRLFCMCNTSSEELARLRQQFPAFFGKFHAIFASGEEGVCKPSLRFLQIAMEKGGLCAHRTLYLDSHDWESIIAARSLGMSALRIRMEDISNVHPYHAVIRSILHIVLKQHLLPSTYMFPSSSSTASLTMSRKTEVFCNLLQSSRASLRGSTSILPRALPHHWSSTLASARQFLLKNGANNSSRFIWHASLTSEGIRIHDNFAQFLMADLLDDGRFLPMQSPPANGLICFINKTPNIDNKEDDVKCFDDAPVDFASDACTFKDIPEDLDTTSIGLSVLHRFGKVGMATIHEVLDRMLQCVSQDDGILQVYFELERPRIDPVTVANAVFLFHLAKRGHEVEKSERFLESVLLHRAYAEGTLYYNLGEAFLVSIARLVQRFEEHFTQTRMRRMLTARLLELVRQKQGSNILALLMRMRACALCGLEEDAHTMKEEVGKAQKKNGSWDGCGYYRYGSNAQSWIGNEALTTAYAYALLAR